jgi:hypothetical protein
MAHQLVEAATWNAMAAMVLPDSTLSAAIECRSDEGHRLHLVSGHLLILALLGMATVLEELDSHGVPPTR